MGLLTELGKGQGYLRAGFLGFQSSGKTFTAVTLATGLYRHLKLKGRIAMFDTEGGSEYIADRVMKETGQKLLGVKSESFADLMAMANECLEAGVDVLVVDSVTHVWREICDSYLEHVNEKLKAKNMFPRTKLEFQDWGPIKKEWARWTRFFLNAPVHVIICGRAGFEYENEINDETGKRELIKVGTKMKTETEFGFEPSLLIEMERREVRDPKSGDFKMVHHAMVNKDRFDVMDGMECDDPTFDFFLPHISRLTPGVNTPIVHTRTPMLVDEQGRTELDRIKLRRVKAWEEIENGLAIIYPSSQGKDKQARFLIYQELAGTVSETKLQQLPPEQLELMADTVRQLGRDLAAGHTIENAAAHCRAIYDGLVASPRQTVQSQPLKASPPDPWLSEVIDCEDVLRATPAGKKNLDGIRTRFGITNGEYPLLDEDRVQYLACLKAMPQLQPKKKGAVV